MNFISFLGDEQSILFDTLSKPVALGNSYLEKRLIRMVLGKTSPYKIDITKSFRALIRT